MTTHEIIVEISKQDRTHGACKHEVKFPADKPHLKKDNQSLGWRIKNTCGLDQNVLLCTYRKDPSKLLINPFHPCKTNAKDIEVEEIFKAIVDQTLLGRGALSYDG